MAFRSFLQNVGIRQRRAEMITFRVDASAISGTSTAGLLEGTHRAVISSAGTGDYTITLNEPAQRVVVVLGVVPLTAGLSYLIVPTEAGVQVVFDDDGVATETDFHISLMAYYATEQR